LNFAGDGGADDMKGNIQHSTLNAQRPRAARILTSVRSWKLNVQCPMFLLLSAWSLHSQTNALPALIPAYPELSPTFWQRHQSSIIAAGLALAALVVLLLITRRRREKRQVLPPEVVARQALARLQNEPEDGIVLSAVAKILRRYVSERFDLPNGEMTTAEFCSAITANEKLGAELVTTVSSFLQECDVRKFSPTNATAPLNAVSRAAKLVEMAEARCMENKAQSGGPRD